SVRRRLDILIVDDDADIRASLRGLLEDEGYGAIDVADARVALAALKAGRFDIMLLDVRMPGMTGLDTLPLIREMAPSTAVVMVAGGAGIRTAVDAVKRGAFDFVEKPVDPEHLLSVIL